MKYAQLLVLFFACALVSAQVGPQFVALDDNGVGTSTLVKTKSLRMWDVGTTWANTNPASGVYDWTTFDKVLENAKVLGIDDILFTFSDTPQWASSKADSTCKQGHSMYSCSPPKDVATTDQMWKDFVNAVIARSEARINGRPRINYFEGWNEPGWVSHWNGTTAQLARMNNDMCNLVHAQGLICGTPPQEAQFAYQMKFWNGFAAAGGLQAVDTVNFHGYTNHYPEVCGTYAIAEEVSMHISNLNALMAAHGVHKPLWDTEGSWGQTSRTCIDASSQAAWVAKFYLVQASLGVQRVYWYAFIGDWGGLVVNGTLLPSGIAYNQMVTWLQGSVPAKPCSAQGMLWTCNFTRNLGYASQAVWDSSSANYTLDPKWKFIRKLDGTRVAIAKGTKTIQINAKPILLENQ